MHEVIGIMGKVGMSDWVEEQSKRKWKWCGHTMRLLWMPDHGHRNRGHRFTRWCDSIAFFMSDVLHEKVDINDCLQVSSCRELLANLEEHYTNFCRDDIYTEIDPDIGRKIHELRARV